MSFTVFRKSVSKGPLTWHLQVYSECCVCTGWVLTLTHPLTHTPETSPLQRVGFWIFLRYIGFEHRTAFPSLSTQRKSLAYWITTFCLDPEKVGHISSSLTPILTKKNIYIKQRTQRCFHRSLYPEEPGFVLEVTFPAAPLAAVLLGLLRVAVPQGAHLHQAALALDQSARHNASTSHSVSRARLHPPGSLNSSTREAEPFVFPLPALKHDPCTVPKACTRTVLPGNW